MTTCSVGCKLTNGIILESGITIHNGNVVRLPEYKRVVLYGSNQSRIRPDSSLAAPLHFTPGVTEGVDEQFFDKWVNDHKDSNLVRNGLIWKMKNKGEALARAADETQKDTGMEPRKQEGAVPGVVPRTED